VTSIVIVGGPTADSVDIQSIAAGVTSIDVQGQGNPTTLQAPSGGTNVWHIISAGGGSIDIGSQVGIVTYSGVTNLSGGGDDHFSFEGGSVPGNIVGASPGSATLDYSNLAGPVTVDIQTGTANYITGTFSNITNFIGSASNSDTLIGDATWDITGTNSGTVNGLTFSSPTHWITPTSQVPSLSTFKQIPHRTSEAPSLTSTTSSAVPAPATS
jgi:hypothetical protein